MNQISLYEHVSLYNVSQPGLAVHSSSVDVTVSCKHLYSVGSFTPKMLHKNYYIISLFIDFRHALAFTMFLKLYLSLKEMVLQV